mgnify:CR=1 FL=1
MSLPLRRRALLSALTVPLAAGALGLAALPAWAALKVQTVARGLVNPWSLAFLPDGRMLVTERAGRMRIVAADGQLGPPLPGLPPVAPALALEVGSACCAMADVPASTVPSVFVSAHGDLAINDHMCSTLVHSPTMLSPTKFHNSVHNAAAGYWTMGTACHEASTALTAFEWSFANGLLAASVQSLADDRPVLLVGYDVQAVGALASVTRSEGLLAVALLLSPRRSARTVASLQIDTVQGTQVRSPLHSAAARSLAANAMADALPLAEALARLTSMSDEPGPGAGSAPAIPLILPLSDRQALQLSPAR